MRESLGGEEEGEKREDSEGPTVRGLALSFSLEEMKEFGMEWEDLDRKEEDWEEEGWKEEEWD